MGRSWKIQTAIGSVLLAGAAVMASLPFMGSPPEVAFGAIGPGIAGSINLGLGLAFRRAMGKSAPQTPLSGEARSLLMALWTRANVWSAGGWRPRHAPHMGPHAWPMMRPVIEPPKEAMEALEAGAAAHNRVMAVVSSLADERSARLRAAADAGMVELLHRAATITTYPEGVIAGVEAMGQGVERMNELAHRVEGLANGPDLPTNLRSTLEATLDEMRAEEVARQELRG